MPQICCTYLWLLAEIDSALDQLQKAITHVSTSHHYNWWELSHQVWFCSSTLQGRIHKSSATFPLRGLPCGSMHLEQWFVLAKTLTGQFPWDKPSKNSTGSQPCAYTPMEASLHRKVHSCGFSFFSGKKRQLPPKKQRVRCTSFLSKRGSTWGQHWLLNIWQKTIDLWPPLGNWFVIIAHRFIHPCPSFPCHCHWLCLCH